MKVLKATLAFVMGLVLGIILLVLAIGGTVVALGTTRTVGELQSAVTDTEIISSDSELFGQSVLEAVQKALNDYQNFDNITLKLLYDRYGINLLKGISGLDFSKKSFYDTPLTEIINDLSLLLDDIYLSDIESIAKMDFSKYNLPILDENMNVGLTKAIDNIMGLVNDNLSIRTLKAKLGFDIGTEDNGILKAMQDVRLNELGGLIDVLPIGVLLTADTDTYLPKGEMQVYVNVEGTAEEWEEVTAEELSNPDYAAPLGVETYISGGLNDELVEKELRYYKKADSEPYVDNSCYNEGWTCPEGVKVLRHRFYKQFDGDGSADGKYYVVSYANRVKTFDNAANIYALIVKDFVSLDDIFVSETGAKLDKTGVTSGKLDLSNTDVYYFEKAKEGEEGATDKYVLSDDYSILEKEMKKNDMLRVPDEPGEDEEGNPVEPAHPYINGRAKYVRIHLGEASSLLQYLNYLTIGYIRNDTDSVLKSLRIGDIIDTNDPDVADILKALKDSTLDSIGEDINSIPFGDMFEPGDSKLLNAIKDFTLENMDENIDSLKLGDILSEEDKQDNQLIQALDARGCTIGNIGTALDQLTVGELLDVKYDVYEKDDAGNYIKIPVYVKINQDLLDMESDPDKSEMFEQVFANVYRPDKNGEDGVLRRGNYTPADEETGSPEEFVEAADGEYIETYYYLYQDESYFDEHAEVERFKRQPVAEGESQTALAVQSLARRGVPALEMGDYINELSIGELMEVDSESSQLFKTLARRGSTMDSISKDIDDLEVADMIEIGDDSSKIMRSLKARHCKIGDMATITDELTLDEILDITHDTYVQADDGIYVHVTDPNSYVLYDETNPDNPEWRTKYVKVEKSEGEGEYEYVEYDPEDPKHEGKTLYVHSAYYTLYNPAVHTSTTLTIGKGETAKTVHIQPKANDEDAIARFNKIEYDASQDPTGEEEPSSKILQRFAGSTMGDFSGAFDELMLSEVLDIDPDIYAEVGKDDIKPDNDEGGTGEYYYGETYEERERLYKYDDVNSVYSVASQADLKEAAAGKLTLYRVEKSGSSTSILKKLAYVKVNEMSDALETVMKDMMLSEIIDINKYDAIDSSGLEKYTNQSTEGLENSRFFVPWDGSSEIDGKPIVYVYESTGQYIMRAYYYHPIDEKNAKEVEEYLGEKQTGFYKYVKYEDPQGNSVKEAANLKKALIDGNVYYSENEKGPFDHNIALATYLIRQNNWDNLYYRETSSEKLDGEKYFEYFSYKNIPSDYKERIYVETLGKKTFPDPLSKEPKNIESYYNPTNPAHAELTKYVKLEDGQNHIVPLNEDGYDYKEGIDVRIGAQYAQEIMIKYPDLPAAQSALKEESEYSEYEKQVGCDKVYVYTPATNEYVLYSESADYGDDAEYYIKKLGYIAQKGEVFYNENSADKTALNFQIIQTMERERSSKVLALLADKTVNDMNSTIENATIGDFMDVTPGTIFDDKDIRESQLHDLGNTLANKLATITIGKLIEWGSITTIDPSVLNILHEVTLTDFFYALTYDDSTGMIAFDMAKLYGIESESTAP